MTGEVVVRENPARIAEAVGTVAVDSPDSVDAVVRAADRAFAGWSAVGLERRVQALRAAADRVEPEASRLAELMARETGKVLADCRGELGFALTYLRWSCDQAGSVLADREVEDPTGRMLVQQVPYGVVAAVTPWNAPIILAMLKIAPALAAGNTVVVKPSPLAPFALAEVVRLMCEVLPGDVLSIVHGAAATGDALVSHPLVRKVAFTGGDPVGREIAAAAGRQLTPVVLELGGNDPAVFLDDAVLDEEAMQRLVMASFATSGQVCMAAKRLYVARNRYEEFVDAYVAAADAVLTLDDPLADGATMGPVVTAGAVERIGGLLVDARAAGATVRDVGRVGVDLAAGYFVAPTVVLGAPDSATVVAEEQFGPTVPILAFDDVDEVVVRANAGDLGLGASVWSADEDRAFAVARRLDAGFRFVNTHNRTGMALRAPFGGVKRSGFGREYGLEGIAEYAQPCVVNAPAAYRPGADRSTSGPASYPSA